MAASPDTPAVNRDVLPALSLMLAHASGRAALPDGEFTLLSIALRRNQVTIDEAMNAFWKAYADSYVPQGRIQFRHLWKYIDEARKGNWAVRLQELF